MNVRLRFIFACFGMSLATMGCSRGPEVGTIQATVTLDGKPLEQGAVRLVSLTGSAPTAGGSIENGKFESSVRVGKYRVEIQSNQLQSRGGKKADPNKKVDKFANDSDERVIALVPAKYNTNSTLEIDVHRGANPQAFELTTK